MFLFGTKLAKNHNIPTPDTLFICKIGSMNFTKHSIYPLFILLLVASLSFTAGAFPTDTYTPSSVLSSGTWVKVSVTESGMHFLPAARLRAMGFNDPMRVRVYGYGASRLPDRLDRDSYIDDLPMVQSKNTSAGVYFYATGPVSHPLVSGSQFSIEINPYTTLGYYFLTESDTPLRDIPSSPGINAEVTTSYQECIYHKREIFSAGETGHKLLGEDFLTQRTQSFTFNTPGRVAGSKAWLECSFWANSSSSSRIVLSVNDNALTYTSSDNIAGNSDHYRHAYTTVTRKTFDLNGDKARITVSYSPTAVPSMARLDYLIMNYERRLELSAGSASFQLVSKGGSLSGASAATHLWDVTDPLDIKSPESTLDSSTLQWHPITEGLRRYVAWQEGATLPSPVMVERIDNQDLHAQPVPDMVIFTHRDWRSQAERVATLHRDSETDPLNVLVVDQQEVFNEFSSGSPDANALRYLLKMFWDRSSSIPGDNGSHRLRYALIMGRSTYDNRRITPVISSLSYPTVPGWQTESSDHDNTSFTTDDIYALLSDDAGGSASAMGSGYQCIAVGRMPVVSLNDARNVVDKLYAYVNTPVNSSWKNRALMIADDENGGVFMTDTEKMIANALSVPGSERIIWDKVYIDAYEKQNSTYPGARTDMFRALTEGVMWWNFAGHANPTSWTGDGLMTYTDINNLYLKHFPFVVAATCDFVRWDASTISAAEILYRSEGSGIIGAFSATRPVFIGDNGMLMSQMGYHMFALDSEGRNLPVGEIMRRTKNGSAGSDTWSNENKLRYVFLGDPAMRLCIPVNRVSLDAIDGSAPSLENQTTMMASGDVTLEGSVTDTDGNTINDFNGKLFLTLYDAEHSTTSNGNGKEGEQVTFEQHGDRLQAQIDTIINGRYKVNLIMPSEIANNFRPATLNMYAVSDDGRDATGVNSDFYVYGTDENSVADNQPPVIEAFYLNHSSFNSGDDVNNTPIVIAEIRDNRSINLSSAGIGHQMLLTIDGRSLTDTPLYYTPYSDGTPGGTLVYQLGELGKGHHELRLRVWDTSGNSTSATIDFNVIPGLSPFIHDIYATPNPAQTQTSFYISHDRPDSRITVNIEVFNMLGKQIWTTSINGMSDTLRPVPVNWDLTDNAGHRVPRGIYLYRASITSAADGITSATKTKRIAVTAP